MTVTNLPLGATRRVCVCTNTAAIGLTESAPIVASLDDVIAAVRASAQDGGVNDDFDAPVVNRTATALVRARDEPGIYYTDPDDTRNPRQVCAEEGKWCLDLDTLLRLQDPHEVLGVGDVGAVILYRVLVSMGLTPEWAKAGEALLKIREGHKP